MPHAYLSLGTNLAAPGASKSQTLDLALGALRRHVGQLLSRSSYHETLPWGYESANTYVNAAALFETGLTPLELLDATQDIERKMGRTEKSHDGRYSDRIIDIDIIYYDDLVVDTARLTLPHPLMARRLFVLEPLAEIAPQLVHPLLGQTTAQLLGRLRQE